MSGQSQASEHQGVKQTEMFADEQQGETDVAASDSTSTSTPLQSDASIDEGENGPTLSSLTPAQLYELTQDVLDEAASSRPLMTDILPITSLRAEYEGGSGTFVRQIDYLISEGFKGIRRTRGDGDCFYRSLAFAHIERIMFAHDQTLAVASALSTLDANVALMEAAGFQKIVFEDFYEVLVSIIRQIIVPEPGGTTLTSSTLLEAFQSPEVASSVVVFMRLLTSACIRCDPDAYAPFLFNPETGESIEPRDFCERYVEAIGKEADHVQITALTRIMRTTILVAYLDGRSDDGTVNFVEFRNTPPDMDDNLPVLLYRPGHYDILEKKSE